MCQPETENPERYATDHRKMVPFAVLDVQETSSLDVGASQRNALRLAIRWCRTGHGLTKARLFSELLLGCVDI